LDNANANDKKKASGRQLTDAEKGKRSRRKKKKQKVFSLAGINERRGDIEVVVRHDQSMDMEVDELSDSSSMSGLSSWASGSDSSEESKSGSFDGDEHYHTAANGGKDEWGVPWDLGLTWALGMQGEGVEGATASSSGGPRIYSKHSLREQERREKELNEHAVTEKLTALQQSFAEAKARARTQGLGNFAARKLPAQFLAEGAGVGVGVGIGSGSGSGSGGNSSGTDGFSRSGSGSRRAASPPPRPWPTKGSASVPDRSAAIGFSTGNDSSSDNSSNASNSGGNRARAASPPPSQWPISSKGRVVARTQALSAPPPPETTGTSLPGPSSASGKMPYRGGDTFDF